MRINPKDWKDVTSGKETKGPHGGLRLLATQSIGVAIICPGEEVIDPETGEVTTAVYRTAVGFGSSFDIKVSGPYAFVVHGDADCISAFYPELAADPSTDAPLTNVEKRPAMTEAESLFAQMERRAQIERRETRLERRKAADQEAAIERRRRAAAEMAERQAQAEAEAEQEVLEEPETKPAKKAEQKQEKT